MMTQRTPALRRLCVPALILLFLALIGAGLVWLLDDLPSLRNIDQRFYEPSVRITDRHGRLLYEMLPSEGGRHAPLPLEQMPLALRQATVATEDRNFYQNPGIEPLGMLRALWINLRGGETLSGGSTITQQVVRNLLLDPQERSLRRKLREMLLAWQLTRRLGKDQILELYLNQTYYGGLAYGAEAAARTFFGKPAVELDLAECALLAGLPQAPALYNPFIDLEAARRRQGVVLDLMLKAGSISAEQRDLAALEPLVLSSNPYPMQAPHFVLMVRSQVDALFTPAQVREFGGLVVTTTLDANFQQAAEKAVADQLARLRSLEALEGAHNVHNAALAALDPHSGAILALVGSPDYSDAEHAGALNMALAPRQPGSALKPLIYAAAFDPARSQPATAASLLLDVRTNFVTHDNQPYSPVNYDGQEHGPVLVREALASSLNIPAVRMLDRIGLPALFQFAAKLGISSLGDAEHTDLSLALGGGEVSLLELTAAYAAFASGGYRIDPFAIQQVATLSGEVVYRAPEPPRERVLDERVAWLISDILSDDDARLMGFQRNSVLRLDRPAAVKTGTTTDFHDNWTVGYTPGLVVGAWAGNATHEAMRDISGLTGAAPIWAQAMRSMLAGAPEEEFTRPPGLVQVEVCALSGLLPTPDCPYRKLEWFIEGTQPTQADTFYRRVVIDSASGALADEATPPERRAALLALDLPAQLAPWARAHGLPLLGDLLRQSSADAPGAGTGSAGTGETPLSLRSPGDRSVYQISAVLPLADQRVLVEAAGDASLAQVTLYVDGLALAALDAPPYAAWWALLPGAHEAWAVGIYADGSRVESPRVRFEVGE